jgi:hypothetical protein
VAANNNCLCPPSAGAGDPGHGDENSGHTLGADGVTDVFFRR